MLPATRLLQSHSHNSLKKKKNMIVNFQIFQVLLHTVYNNVCVTGSLVMTGEKSDLDGEEEIEGSEREEVEEEEVEEGGSKVDVEFLSCLAQEASFLLNTDTGHVTDSGPMLLLEHIFWVCLHSHSYQLSLTHITLIIIIPYCNIPFHYCCILLIYHFINV